MRVKKVGQVLVKLKASKKKSALSSLVGLIVFIAPSFFAHAYDSTPEPVAAETRPAQLEGVGISEKLGTDLDLNLQFTDENGQAVVLKNYFDGVHPVIISPVYYGCGSLCNFHLNGLFEGLKGMDWTAGKEFQLLAISFDDREKSELALRKRESYLKIYDRPQAAAGIHFLTGSTENIQKLTKALGFSFKWNDSTKDWAHSSAAVIGSPQGKIVRYLPGISFLPNDLRLAINESANGKVGTFVDSLVLYCFQYNPHKSGYSLAAFKLVQLGGLITVIFLAFFLLQFWLRTRKNQKQMARSSL